MNNSFQKFYDSNPSYIKRRDIGSKFRKNYVEEIKFWKNKYLSSILLEDLEINNIVEIGSATGDLISSFPSKVPMENRYGVDISKKNIEAAKELYPQVNFYCGSLDDFIETKGKDISIDIIILSDILEHIVNDCEILKIAGDVSKFVLLNLPLEKCLKTLFRSYGINDFAGHLRAYNFNDAIKLINNANLKIINSKTKYYCKENLYKKHLNSSNKGHLKLIIIKTIDKFFYKIFNVKNLFALLVKK